MLKFFLLFLISFGAFAQGDLSGNLRSQGAPTFANNFGKLQVPNFQATKTGAVDALIETGNKNLFRNSGFEHQTYSTGWTTSGTATYSGTTTASEVLSGLKSFKAVASAQTIDLVQDTTLYAAARAGSQMFWRFSAKNTASGVTACVRKNSVKQTGSNDCLTLATDGVTKTYELAFLADGTSNGIEIDAASTTGTLIVDDVELSTESSAFVDVAQIGPWISYTPTFQGFGSPTNIEFQYRVNGSNLDIRGKFTSGTSTAVEARVGLPSGFTSATSATIPSIQIVGFLTGTDSTGSPVQFPLIEPSVNYVTIGIRSASSSNGLTKINANAVFNNGQSVSFFASVPVQGLSNKVSTYSQACTTDVQCENVFSAKVSATGVVSDENLDWINGNCSTVGDGITCTYNTSIFTQAPNCTAINNPATGSDKIAYIIGISNTLVSVSHMSRTDASSTVLDEPFQIICTKQGADFKAKNVITGTFKDVVTTPNSTGKPVLCATSMDASNGETSDVCNMVSNNTGGSPRTVNFTANFWASTPLCWCNAGFNSTLGSSCDVSDVTTSSASAQMYNNNARINNAVTLFCMGVIQ